VHVEVRAVTTDPHQQVGQGVDDGSVTGLAGGQVCGRAPFGRHVAHHAQHVATGADRDQPGLEEGPAAGQLQFVLHGLDRGATADPAQGARQPIGDRAGQDLVEPPAEELHGWDEVLVGAAVGRDETVVGGDPEHHVGQGGQHGPQAGLVLGEAGHGGVGRGQVDHMDDERGDRP